MATIINTPGGNPDGESSAAGWVVAIVAIVLLGLLGMWFLNKTDQEDAGMQQGNTAPGGGPAPTVNNFNTTVNSTTTVTGTTTDDN